MQEEIKSYSELKKIFYEKYKNKILPVVKKYDNIRKKKLVIAIISSGILFLIGTILLLTGFINNREEILQISIIVYVLSYFMWKSIKKSFENSIKEKIMPSICKCFGDLKWVHKNYSDGYIFSASLVIPKFKTEIYDDIFKGSYKDVNIEIVEAEYRIKTSKSIKTVFKGIIIKLEMNKTFSSHTIIKPNTLLNISPSLSLHHIELEDIVFNKKFDVFTNDEVEARYLITPSFMNRLKKMKTAFSASNISCAFFNNFLIVALPTTKDIFSICSLVMPIENKEQYFKMFKEIHSVIKLIDHFKLNQKTGL